MELTTRLFGTVTYEQDDVITFPKGIPSFETEREFLLLPLDGSEGGLFCLQSIATPVLSFILMDPFSLDPSYTPRLQPCERMELGVAQDEDLCYFVLCAMKRPISQSTVNLRCPIVINPDLGLGCQVILETDAYHMHYPLEEFATHKGGSPC